MLEKPFTIQETLQFAMQTLQANSETPLLDAEILLAFALEKPRSYLHAWREIKLTICQAERFKEYLERRAAREPVAYITGYKEFWSLPLTVNTDTLIPRPETELLVEKALELIDKDKPNVRIADLGTGSGAIAIALAFERPHWQLVATDICQRSLEIAKKNAQHLKLTNIHFIQGNWCQALPTEQFDMIISNPPYISESEWEDYAKGLAFEPTTALLSGEDGLCAIRAIAQEAKPFLKKGGSLLIEHGSLQAKSVRDIFLAKGYSKILTLADFAQKDRVTLGAVRRECAVSSHHLNEI